MTDITALENTTEAAEEGLAVTAKDPSIQILRSIEIVEENLRKKRSRVEEIQLRRDHLVGEYTLLNKTLELENSGFVQELNAVINDLDTDGAIVELHPDMPTTETSQLDTDTTDRDQQAQGSPDDKPGSLRWLQKKERKRWES